MSREKTEKQIEQRTNEKFSLAHRHARYRRDYEQSYAVGLGQETIKSLARLELQMEALSGIHYSDVGEKERAMEFQEWIETDEAFPVRKAFVRSEDGMYAIFKQIYKAGQNSVK